MSRTLDIPLRPHTYSYGAAFETFFINEVLRLNEYYRKNYKFSYLRIKDDAEVDLVIERAPKDYILVEIESSATIQEKDTRIIQTFFNDLKATSAILASNDPISKVFQDVNVLPWQKALERIFE